MRPGDAQRLLDGLLAVDPPVCFSGRLSEVADALAKVVTVAESSPPSRRSDVARNHSTCSSTAWWPKCTTRRATTM
jgi:hypothetical protein